MVEQNGNKLPLTSNNAEFEVDSDKQSQAQDKVGEFVKNVTCPEEDDSPPIITEEKLKCYEKFHNVPIIIEGPEQSQDYSYFLVDKNDDLKFLEGGLALDDFENMKEKRKYDMEFRILQRMTQHKGHVKNLFNSPSMEFKKQNRFNEVLPFNHSRVILKEVPGSVQKDGSKSNEELNLYINANYINTLVKGKGSKAMIATQAPLEYTFERFWQMVWENKCELIIMLCPLQGPKKEEATNYWVDTTEPKRVFGSDSFELEFIEEKKVTEGITERKFSLKNLMKPEDDSLIVTHMQTTRWEDDDAKADEPHFTDVDYFVKAMKQYHNKEDSHPIVIHCSAGIGRTGTLISIFSIIDAIEKIQEQKEALEKLEIDDSIRQDYKLWGQPRISVFGTVRKMREQRWNMVKKLVQYGFIYEYVERWVRKNQFDMFNFDNQDELLADGSVKSGQIHGDFNIPDTE